jgi:hypothetical protein
MITPDYRWQAQTIKMISFGGLRFKLIPFDRDIFG